MDGYMTTREAAEKWGITQRQVQLHCQKKHITGVVKVGTNYLIPKDTQRPLYGYHVNYSSDEQQKRS